MNASLKGTWIVGCGLALAIGGGVRAASSEPLPEQVRRDAEWLAAGQTRLVGTAEHDAALAGLIELLRAARGAKVWTQAFPVVVPKLEKSVLVVAAGPLAGTHSIYPVWPDLVRLKTTSTNGIAGTLNYIGAGAYEGIRPLDLNGNIAVMEMKHYENWKNPFEFGAAAVLLLAGREPMRAEPSPQPLYMPRYYVPEGLLANALRKGEIARATILCSAAWVTVTATNAYALVVPAGFKGGQQAMVIAGQFDGMSTIMGLAPGADAAVDSALLLNLLRTYADHPPAKPVLFAFLDAVGINQLGVRRMLGMLASVPGQKDRRRYEQEDLKQIESSEEIVALFNDLAGGGGAALDEEALSRFHRSKYRALRPHFKNEISPELRVIEQELSGQRLRLTQLSGPERVALQAQIDSMAARRARLNSIKNQVLGGRGVSSNALEEALAFMTDARQRSRRHLAEVENAARLYDRDDWLRAKINAELGIQDSAASPAFFLLGVDLSDAGITAGPQLSCAQWRYADALAGKDFMRWLRVCASGGGARIWNEQATRAVNMESIVGFDDASSFNGGSAPALVSAAGNFDLPSATWATLDAFRLKVDTPFDVAAGLDWTRIVPQMDATVLLIDRMLNGVDFTIPGQTGMRPQWRRAMGTIVDVSVGDPVPSVPMEHFLATAVPNWIVPEAVGVRRAEFQFTEADGGFRLEGLPAGAQDGLGGLHVEAFQLGEEGSIRRTARKVDPNKASKENPKVNLSEASPGAMGAVVFDCVELNGPEFFDSRYLVPLSDLSLIDKGRGGAPQWSNVTIVGGQMHALIEKRIVWQAVLREGSAGVRMALVNLSDVTGRTEGDLRKAMRGRKATEGLTVPATYPSVLDFHSIDAWRLRVMHEAGIRVPPVDRMFSKAETFIAAAGSALAENDAAGMFKSAVAAMATEIRAYETIKATNDDVARGAIFLLLLIVPFSVVMERLLFASAAIVRRIAGASGIFVVMAGILWSFHPAFRISSQPVIILMSFSILLLSAVVIGIVMTRFGAFLDEIRRGRAEAGGAETARGGLISSAVWLGIGNMRKRKFRTALTATTIVLITFALLCFSSARNYTEKRQYRLADKGPARPSILVRQPGMQTLHPRAATVIQSLIGAGRLVVPRYWLVNASKDWRIHLRSSAGGKSSSLKGLIGLAPEEARVSEIGSLVGKWDRFAQGDGCYLARTTAESLGVKAGDKVVLSGLELEVLDTYDSRAFKAAMRQLDGTSILPIDFTALDDRQASQTRDLSVTEKTRQAVSFTDIKQDQQLPTVEADDVAVVHHWKCRQLGGEMRNIAVPLASKEEAAELASCLVDSLAFPVYYGDREGVSVAVAVPLLPKAPRSLFIPLGIAALIILNTMMNSVAERKSEIHVYTSLGLAPRHVGALFIAEAATYGLMGSICGYVVGQGLASLLTKFNLMGGITLNYSGTQVIMTMGLVLGVTMLSGVIPAIMAGKIATPSHATSWKLAAPVEGVITDHLPFTATPVAADGVMAFIYEYMDAHKDGAIGHFTCDNLSLRESPGEKIMESTVWLAPYDLGVKQDVRLTITQVEEDVAEVDLQLRRLAGEESSWRKLNRPFVADLRRQFLGWHKLGTDRVLEYIERGRKGGGEG